VTLNILIVVEALKLAYCALVNMVYPTIAPIVGHGEKRRRHWKLGIYRECSRINRIGPKGNRDI
jgi:hypothetical protein